MSCSVTSESPSPPSSDWSPTISTQKRLKNVSILEERNQTSPSPPLVDTGILFWNASLLYHTGLSSPKIKKHHLRSTVSMSDMNRPQSPASKLLTKSPSNDSGTGTYSSAATVVSSNGDEDMSPLRKRHLSCGSSSTASSSSATGSLKKGKLSSSMRMMKAISKRPTLAAFMEKTQSLGRYNKSKSVPPPEMTDLDETTSTSNSTETTTTTNVKAIPSSSSSSTTGLSSTAKAFRDSFRAARNLLPSSSKLTIANRTSGSSGSLKKEISSSCSSLHSDTNGSASTINYSAPNTPKVTGKGSVKNKNCSVGDLTLSASSNSVDIDPRVNSTFTPTTAVVTTKTKKSSKTSSLDCSSKDSVGSKSISSKLKKSKEKQEGTEKVATKKVSLVKSLTRMRIGSRSKERMKDKDLSPSTESVSESKSPALQEIVELDNEPRVRTPKTVRNRLSTPTSHPEKDREFNEMEVSEDAVEVARKEEKLLPEMETNKSQTETNKEAKSQTSVQFQPSVITDEGKKSSSKPKDKGSKKKAGSSTSDTLKGDDKNNSYPEGFPPLPPTIKKGKVKGGKTGGKGKKSSLTEPEETKVLETKLDLDDDDEINQEPGTGTKDEQPDAARSSDNLREDKVPTSPNDQVDNKANEEFKTDPEPHNDNASTLKDEEGVVVSQQENNANVTSGPDNKDLMRRRGSSGSQDEETYCTDSFRQLKPFNFDLEPIAEGKRERLYKVLVVGELGAGKTSIIKRYVHQFFSQHYRATIGVDFALKVLRWDPETVVRLQLWDIAGQERFGSMTRVYYKEAVGAFVVFDVTRGATLEAVPKWKADLDSKVALPDGRPIPTVLLANKSDQPKEGIAANREKMNDFCQQQGFAAWFETSAKDNINIDESANFLVSKILEIDRWSTEPQSPDPDKVDLSANGKLNSNAASNCSC